MSAKNKSDAAVWGVVVAVLSILMLVEVSNYVVHLGEAMHDIYCQDH